MDDFTRKHETASDEEKSFAETLLSEHVPAESPAPEPRAAEPQSPGKRPPWVGKIMGHFRLLRLIGQGAMGMVIQAEDTHLRRIVALKVLRKNLTTGEKGKLAVEQFLREARAAAAIEHPNIVRIYEINQHADWWYIAMEMVEGNSLQDIIKAAGALPPARACPIIADTALGLQAAHELGIIHRDIKPGNILVTRTGRGKLTDFGLVRMDNPNDPIDTFAHKSIGTPLYMAPEIIRRQAFGPAVDIYSLGATLYYTLAGRPPYTAEKMEDVLEQHLNKAPPDIQETLEQCSPTLAGLIVRMMSKEPQVRPTAADVAAMLHAEAISAFPDASGLTGAGLSAAGTAWQSLTHTTRLGATGTAAQLPLSTTGSMGQRYFLRRPLWAIALAALLLVVGASAAWYIVRKTPKPQPPPDIRSLFPDAPDRYGIRNPGSVPEHAGQLNAVPEYSWKGKVDLSGYYFVASRNGKFYFPIQDERAILIRAELVKGYQTAEQARNDGKIPAP